MICFGVIGLGIGERHVSALVNDKRVSVDVVCDFEISKAESIASKYNVNAFCSDWTRLLSDFELDAVIIASYDHFHAEQLVQFIRQGIHIFVEKPLCTTLQELDAIEHELALAEKSRSIYISTNFILRKEKRFSELHQKISQGDLGTIYSVEASYDYGRIHKIFSGWRATSPNYSVMNGGGIHMLDLCQWLVGECFSPKFAMHNKVVTADSDFLAPDFTSSMGTLGENIIFKVTANFGSQTPHYHQLKIYGTKGTFINDCEKGTYFFGNEPEVKRVEDENDFPCANKGDLLPNFISAILGECALEVVFSDVASVMRTSLMIDHLANGS